MLHDVDSASALSAARRVQAAVDALRIPHAGSKTSNRLTVTVGLACGSAGDSFAALLARADAQAMSAKRRGLRNAVHRDP